MQMTLEGCLKLQEVDITMFNVQNRVCTYLELEVALVGFVLSYIYYNNYYVFVLFSPDDMYVWVW